jgi:hypothetical protein
MVDPNKNPRFIGKEMDTPSEGGDEYRGTARAVEARRKAGVGEFDGKRFSTIQTQAEQEREKAERQLDPEGYKKKEKEKLKNAGKIVLGFVPVAGTVTYWDEMSPGERAVSVAFDALDVLTIAKGGTAGAVYKTSIGVAGRVKDASPTVDLVKNTIRKGSDDLAEELERVDKAQDKFIKASAKVETKGLNNVTKGEYDDAVIEFTDSWDKYTDKIIETGQNVDPIFGVAKKSDFQSADEIIENTRRLTGDVVDQSDAIINANTKLDKAIKSNPKGISKAVDNLEKATLKEKNIAQKRLNKINQNINFLLESDYGFDDVLSLIEDKKKITKKIKELENVDGHSLQKARTALENTDYINDLNKIKSKQADSLKAMEPEDLWGSKPKPGDLPESDIGLLTAPPKTTPGVGSTPKIIKPGTTSKVVVGSGALTRLTSDESPGESITDSPGEITTDLPGESITDSPGEFESDFETPGDPKIGSYGEEYDGAVEQFAPEEFSTPGATPSPGASPSPGATPSPGASPSPSATPSPGASPFASPSPDATPSPGASPFASPSPGATPSPGASPFATPSPGATPSPFKVPTPRPTKTPGRSTTPPGKTSPGKVGTKPRLRDSNKYKLPGGKTLEPGVFPRVIRFESGINNQIIDLQTGKRIYLDRKTPSTRDSADTFEVLKTSKIKPNDRTFSQGIVNINVTGRGIDFKKKL